jgi:hypothetical protein
MKPEPQGGADEASDYHYRRALTLQELLPAFGVAIGAAAAAFYVARLFLQRTPLVPMRDIPALGPVLERKPRTADDILVRRSSRSGPRASLPPLAPPPTITRRNARRVDAG